MAAGNHRTTTEFFHVAPWAAGAILLGLVLHKAWVGDDAVITARVVDNLLHGYGLRWNVAERVQVFTHPLWAMLLVPLMALGLSWYAALLTLALSITSAAVCGIVSAARRRPLIGIAALAVLGYSRAFLDYSTSGLENPLTTLLVLMLLLVVPPTSASVRDVRRVALVASLLALTRSDAVLIALPACGYVVLHAVRSHARGTAVAAALAVGMLPLLLWETFSIIYYGFPFPNTAYAKLNTSIERLTSLRLGVDYFTYTLTHDSWTLGAPVAISIVILAFRTGAAALALSGGAIAYYAFALWIGGDFMGGRFFVAPLALLTGMLVSRHVRVPRRFEALLLCVVAILGTACWFVAPPDGASARVRGRLDERATYANDTGLLHVLRTGSGVDHGWLRRGAQWRGEAAAQSARDGSPVRLYRHAYAVGMVGLAAGPQVHIIDHLALTDALLARLPAAFDPVVQPGHFERMGQWSSKTPILTQCPLHFEVCRFWRDYENTLRTGVCSLEDPNLCVYWRALRTVTQDDLFSKARWIAIIRLNLGMLDPLIDRKRYREASLEYPGEGSRTR